MEGNKVELPLDPNERITLRDLVDMLLDMFDAEKENTIADPGITDPTELLSLTAAYDEATSVLTKVRKELDNRN